MTTTRDPDRMLRAWLDLMPDEAPDRVIASVLQAAETTRQVRALPWIGRWRLPMNRLSVIATAALVVAALVGGAYLLAGGSNGPAIPTQSPVATPATTGQSGSVLTPEALRSTWVADLRAPTPTAGGPAGLSKLVIEPTMMAIDVAGNRSFVSRPVAGTGSEFTFVSSFPTNGCKAGDLGRYSYAFGKPVDQPDAGDMFLSLTVVADACPARQAAIGRTWVRATETAGGGGRSVATQFPRMFLVTLPARSYTLLSHNTADALMIETADGYAFVAAGNPWGWTQPCTDNGGPKLEVAPTVEAFVAYLEKLPGFTVQQSTVEIDKRPAVHLTVPTTKTADCQNRGANSGRVMEFTNDDPSYPGGWILGQGDADSIYLVEVGGSLYLFQWLGPAMTPQAEMAVLSTISFVDVLPN